MGILSNPSTTATLETEESARYGKVWPLWESRGVIWQFSLGRATCYLATFMLALSLNGNPIICNGNRTEWSPIRSVIIRVINKIGRPRSGSPSMIADRIGRHEVLLPIDHNLNKVCNIWGSFFKSKHKKFQDHFLASSEKKEARVMAHTVHLLRHDAYSPIKLSN